jgi:quinone-modifying oxidoreductase subunit QmoA
MNEADVIIIGGGIAGITAALEAAEAGCRSVIVEKSTTLGGRVAQMHQYFPKLCSPSCGLEMNYRRLRANPRVEVLTLARVESITGSPGAFHVLVKMSPRYVNSACTACGECVESCPAERSDEFNCGLTNTKAIYLPHALANPPIFAINRTVCPEGCDACARACRYGAIELAAEPKQRTFRTAAVIAATGWAPYDAGNLPTLGFGRCRNVLTNVMLERLAASGKILRPSDGKEPRSVAFVQCAGSRDENNLPYCSGVCCAASLKQATYIRSLYPEAKITIFYIDVRTSGLLEEFYARVSPDIELIKGKVGRIEEDAATGDVLLTAEDVMGGRKAVFRADVAVLATGIVPQTDGLPDGFALDEFGFVTNGTTGMYSAGCVRRPAEVSACVQDATGAALKAFQCAVRSARHG